MSSNSHEVNHEVNGKELGVKNTIKTAPTNKNTHRNLKKYSDGTYMAFVALVESHYQMHGVIIDAETAEAEYQISGPDFEHFITFEPVISQLKENGVIRDYVETLVKQATVNNDWRDKTLTPLQLAVANTMLDLIDTRSQKKKLQDLGVSTAVYSNWLKDPNFNNYLRTRAENLMGDASHEAHLALLDKVRMGDTSAIKLYYEITGQYNPASNKSNAQQQDFKLLLVRILEIINDEIDDPAVGARIADKFRELIGAQTMANQLMGSVNGEEVVQPEIMPNRELSPRLKELLS